MQCYALPSMVRAKHISEDLLNTAEAARFLRVSQASIRRWSDSGLLPSHRVGRRRERRFRETDLLPLVDRGIPVPAQAAPLNGAGITAEPPAHLATVFHTRP